MNLYYLDLLVDLDSEPFTGYINALNSADLNFAFTLENTINRLSFSEYKLKQYLERINNKSIKYIKQNIYYCNGKIFYYISTSSLVRVSHNDGISIWRICSTSEEYNSRIRQDNLSEKYHFVNNDNNPPSAPFIHLDYANINNDSDYLDLLNEEDIELSVGCQQTQDYNAYQETFMGINPSYEDASFEIIFSDANIDYERTLQTSLVHTYNGLQSLDSLNYVRFDIINNPQSNIFNIWLLLNESDDDKTLGFFNMYAHITQENSIQDLLKQITNIEDSNSFNSLYSNHLILPNVNRLGNDLYTFSMDKGSALLFNSTEISHTGFTPESGIRISVESRYVLLPYVFDLNSALEISPDGTTLVVKTNVDNVPIELPPYLPLTIYKWFQDEFSLISQQYNRLKREGRLLPRILELEESDMISMRIFQNLLDNVQFKDYKWIPVTEPIQPTRSRIIQTGWNNPGVEAFLTRD